MAAIIKFFTGPTLEEQLFELRFTAKQLNKDSAKATEQSRLQRLKCKKAMEQGNIEGARIHAESAIREKNQALSFLRLSSRIDAVAQRVNTAVKMNQLNKNMEGVVSSMAKGLSKYADSNRSDILSQVMKSMDIEQITTTMDDFEKQFDDLALASSVMDKSIASSMSATSMMPENQIDELMRQVADEHGLEVEGNFASVSRPTVQQQIQQPQVAAPKPQHVTINTAAPAQPQANQPASTAAAKPAPAQPASPQPAEPTDRPLSLEERLRRLQE